MSAMIRHNQLSTCTMDANLGGRACVYGCRHFIWGGTGACEVAGQGDSVHYVCSCDDGYISKDSFGNPSCVRKTALLVIHMTVGSKAHLTPWGQERFHMRRVDVLQYHVHARRL